VEPDLIRSLTCDPSRSYSLVRARHERGLGRRYRPPSGGATVSDQFPINHLASGAIRAALERHGVEASLLGGCAVLLAAALFAGGGSGDGAIFPIGAGAALLAAAAAVAACAGRLSWPRLGKAGSACALLLCLLVLWQGVTVIWSIAPDRSFAYTNRGLAYLAFLVLGLFAAAAHRRAATLLASALSIFVAGALAWALAGKIAPGLMEDGGRVARLRVPVGYWNGLALLLGLGLPLALWLASDRGRSRAVRAAAVACLVALAVGLVLTYSRGGILAAIAAVLVWLAIDRRRIESAAALLLAAPFATGVLVFALDRPGLVEDGQELAARASAGKAFGLALGIALAAAFAAGYGAVRLEAARPLSEERRARIARAAKLTAIGIAVAGALALIVRAPATADWFERQADEFANPPTELVTQEPGRLTSLSSNNRWVWWNEAWNAFQAAPLGGVGASAFPTAHRILRADRLTVTTPHDFPLQLLAETGVVGALLGCGAAAAALAGIACSLRRLGGSERRAAAALAAGIVAFGLHTLVDFDWDFVALAAPVLLALGVLLATGREPVPPRRTLALAALPTALFAAAFVSLGAPWLAERSVDDAYAKLGSGRPADAFDSARRARALNPLSLDPLFARAAAEVALGNVDAARATLIRAVELQPLDADAWYELGAFELDVAGRSEEARRYLERSLELDPFGPAGALLAGLPPA
jgi:tetratricopeptide (TPR) repeat protein